MAGIEVPAKWWALHLAPWAGPVVPANSSSLRDLLHDRRWWCRGQAMHMLTNLKAALAQGLADV